MLNRDTIFRESIERLEAVFSKTLSGIALDEYYDGLKNMNEREFRDVVDRIIREKKFFPKIADFYEVQTPTKRGFWDEHSIFWEIKNGIIKYKIVPKGQGNTKPKITFQYEEIDEATRTNNIYRANMIVKKLAESMATTK